MRVAMCAAGQKLRLIVRAIEGFFALYLSALFSKEVNVDPRGRSKHLLDGALTSVAGLLAISKNPRSINPNLLES